MKNIAISIGEGVFATGVVYCIDVNRPKWLRDSRSFARDFQRYIRSFSRPSLLWIAFASILWIAFALILLLTAVWLSAHMPADLKTPRTFRLAIAVGFHMQWWPAALLMPIILLIVPFFVWRQQKKNAEDFQRTLAGYPTAAESPVSCASGPKCTIEKLDIAPGLGSDGSTDPNVMHATPSNQGIGISVVAFAGPERVIIGSFNGSLLVWDLAGKGEKRTIPAGHTKAITSVAFIPGDSPRIVSASFKQVSIRDINNGDPKGDFTTEFISRYMFVLNDHQEILCMSSRGEIQRSNLRGENKQLSSISNDPAVGSQWITAACKSDDFTKLFCGAVISVKDPTDPCKMIRKSTQIGIVDVVTGRWERFQQIQPKPSDELEGLWVSIDSVAQYGTRLAVGVSESRLVQGLPEPKFISIKIFDISTQPASLEHDFDDDHKGAIRALRFCDGGHHLISGSTDHTIGIRDLREKNNRVCIKGHYGWINSLASDTSGKTTKIASGSFDGTARLWTLEEALRNTTEWAHSGHSGRVRSIAIGGNLVASASFDNTIQFRDLHSRQQYKTSGLTMPRKGQLRDVAFTQDGLRLVSGHSTGRVDLWDLTPVRKDEPPKHVAFHCHERDVFGVATSSDGAVVLSVSEDWSVLSWDTQSKPFHISKPKPQPAHPDPDRVGHKGGVNTVAIAPDGRVAVTGSDDMNVRRWYLDGQNPPKRSKVMRGHRFGCRSHCDQVLDVAISKDGKRALSASKDCVIKLWDVERGRELRRLAGHQGWVLAVAFGGPDDAWAASASVDGEVKIWDLVGSGSHGPDLKRFELAHCQTHSTLYSCAVMGHRLVVGDASGGLHFFQVKWTVN